MTERAPSSGAAPRLRVAIIGSGFGGLGTAIRLRRAGVHDFVVFERATDVGGVVPRGALHGVSETDVREDAELHGASPKVFPDLGLR